MRILSKYKDYYDYFQGIFGMDKTKVYDRRKMVKQKDYVNCVFENDVETIRIAVCNRLYTIYYYKGKRYHTPDELRELGKLRYSKFSYSRYHYWREEEDYNKTYAMENGISTDVNIRERQPVLITKNHYFSRNSNWEVPLLSTFQFHKVIPAKDIYIMIETFLGYLIDNPPLPDNQTNIGKVEAHGFDKKRSFRPKMK